MSLHKEIKELLENKMETKLDTFQYFNLLEAKFKELIIETFKPKEDIKTKYFDAGLVLRNNLRLFFEIKTGDTFSYTDILLRIKSLINNKQISYNDQIIILVKDSKFQHLLKLRNNYESLDNITLISFSVFLNFVEKLFDMGGYEDYLPNIILRMNDIKYVKSEDMNLILSYKEERYVRDFFSDLSNKFIDGLLLESDNKKTRREDKINSLIQRYNSFKDLEELKTKIYEGNKKSKLFYIDSGKNKKGYNVYDLANTIKSNVLFFDFVQEDKLIKFGIKDKNMNCIFYFNMSILEIQSDINRDIIKIKQIIRKDKTDRIIYLNINFDGIDAFINRA